MTTSKLKLGTLAWQQELTLMVNAKKTLCGTPNYIAPEVLYKKGHSFEVDVWSVGCILYTLLVGKPPFETTSLKETYQRIKKNEYYIPARVPQSAQMLIIKMLRPDPCTRPTMKEVRADRFFDDGFTPVSLPNSCLTMAPRFQEATTTSTSTDRRPLGEANRDLKLLSSIPESKLPAEKNNVSRAVFVKDGMGHELEEDVDNDEDDSKDHYLSALLKLLTKTILSKPSKKPSNLYGEAEDPALTPVTWISKWVDYSDKYGIGYNLSDGSVGVLYNDATRLLMNENEKNMQYIDKHSQETFFTIDTAPEKLKKKRTLLEYFHNYMSENLLKAGSGVTPQPQDTARLPYLRAWFRTQDAIILHLNIGILQINFFEDHTKIIICPKMEAVTYIDQHRNFNTYKLSAIEEQYGCSPALAERLKYAKSMVERLQKRLVDEKAKK